MITAGWLVMPNQSSEERVKGMVWRGIVYSFQEGMLAVWRNIFVSLLSIGTIAISFTILGIFLLIAVNVGKMAALYGDTLVIHVFLDDDISGDEMADLREVLSKDRRVEESRYMDKESAANRFSSLFPENDEILKGLDKNPLPSSFEVRLRNDIDVSSDRIEAFVKTLGEQSGVESVLYDREWVETLEKTGTWVVYAGMVLGGLLILAAIVTTSNIIKINVFSHKEEIEIMHLVGADGLFIRGPFLVGGIFQGFLASMLALVILFGIFNFFEMFLKSVNIEMLQGLQLSFLPIWMLLLFSLGGLVVGFLASLLSIGNTGKI